MGTRFPRAEPVPRETREPQPLLLDAEDLSAWPCPWEGSECTIWAGAAPSPSSRLTAPQGDEVRPEGMAEGQPGSGHGISSTRAMCKSPNPSLYENYTRKKKLFVTSLSPPRRRAVRPCICRGSSPQEAWRSFGNKGDTTLGCTTLLPSSPCCGWVPALLGEKRKRAQVCKRLLACGIFLAPSKKS